MMGYTLFQILPPLPPPKIKAVDQFRLIVYPVIAINYWIIFIIYYKSNSITEMINKENTKI